MRKHHELEPIDHAEVAFIVAIHHLEDAGELTTKAADLLIDKLGDFNGEVQRLRQRSRCSRELTDGQPTRLSPDLEYSHTEEESNVDPRTARLH